MNALASLFRREMAIIWRSRSHSAAHLVFVLLMITLFPFVIGPDDILLQRLAPGLLLLAILLGQMLGFERLFAQDAQNGTLDILPGSRLSLSVYALVKSAAQWCGIVLPVLLCSPLFMLLLHVVVDAMPSMLLALILSSITIQLLGMLAAALALGAKSAGLLLPLLLIPFYIPVIIFALPLAQEGLSGQGYQAFYFLSALLITYMCILPFLSGAALASAIEQS